MPPPPSSRRRRLLAATGRSLLAMPLLGLAACRPRGDAPAAASGDTAATDGAAWASGGTGRIGDPARFPDPFATAPAAACVLTCTTTIGPCHAESPERSDVSDGWDGLPLRLALRVVDADCAPVEGALVEIWHTNHTGGYSGRIAAMCNNDADDLGKRFFRGYQRSDADGRVAFDTCYPGWYRGRAVHIHLRVLTGGYEAADDAPAAVTTQLLFSDALNQEIFSSHPLYAGFGLPDTGLDDDNVVGGEADKSPYLFDVQRLDDGVMLASKTLVVQREAGPPACRVQGAGGPGGPGGRGGPPPGPPPDAG
ncbi:hypothetical protein LDO32_00745 [Luteimonas sp. Y-2-2-4F]|nr:hypothetical protein [Luteimonas sp. Y-2-2-4F]MCD9030264.1 hypothetical protein [Luteimonas sp. Y-2-2-4F]